MKIHKLNFKKYKNIFNLFFLNLDIDLNDKKLYGIKPFRSRKILYTFFNGETLTVIKKKGFKQRVSDDRSKKRIFKVFKPSSIQLKILNSMILDVIDYLKTKKINITSNLDITFHFVSIKASVKGETNSPEGIHRDGFDILIPCIVTERSNITGGYSRFFIKKHNNFKLVFKNITNENYGLLVEENKNKELYHDVTPIRLKNKNKPGYRKIIGIDINFIP